MNSDKVIMYYSPEAAREETGISGWVSRDGHYCGKGPDAEHMARYIGCTHVKCDKCGSVHKKEAYCKACYQKRDTEKYNAAPRQKWDGTTPIVIRGSDSYFFDVESLEEYCVEHECQPDDLRLMHCIPNGARLLSSDYFADDLPDGGELPFEIEDAIETFNKAITAYGKPISWGEGGVAVEKPTGIVVKFEREDEEP